MLNNVLKNIFLYFHLMIIYSAKLTNIYILISNIDIIRLSIN